MNWYQWFLYYYVAPYILTVLNPRLAQLESRMSAADDKVAKLTADLAVTDAKVDAMVVAFNSLKDQLENETGLSPDSLAALDQADAIINGIGNKADAAVNPPAPPEPPTDQPPA